MNKRKRVPRRTSRIEVATIATVAATMAATCPSAAFAQDEGAAAPDTGGQTVVVQTAAPEVVVPGYPSPGTELEAHLPSSSRASSDTSSARDDFDLAPGSAGAGSIHGGEGGTYIMDGQYLPESHTVRRGDTLWEITESYTRNPYNWPRIWALNPQIMNPHWIYPGDRVRLRTDAGPGASSSGLFGHIGRPRSVPPETVFLREVGWVDDDDKDVWGELVGSPDDQMLLSENDVVYVQLEDDREASVGQELTIFRPVRDVERGALVSIRGTVKIDRYNAKTHTARGRIVEALDVIERGAKVGPVDRRFTVVPPVANEQDVEARVISAIYPLQFFGRDQVLFINKGNEDGLRPGNRLFAIRRGDPWVDSLDSAGQLARVRPRVEDDGAAEVDGMDLNGDEDDYPDETYAELRVVSVREHSAACLVTASTAEIERDARLVARKGY